MNSKNVLTKILALLSSDDIEMTDAKSANGDILQSPTFDLNEKVEVVSEDGTKTPAPDGEYTISLKDETGNENIIRIEVKDGKITERANEEEEKNETSEEQDMSDAGTLEDPTKGDAQNRKDINSVPGAKVADTKQSDVKMANEFPAAPKGASMEPAHALPNTTDEDPRNRIGPDTDDQKDPIISLEDVHARLTKMEDYMGKIAEKMEMPINPPSEEAGSNQVAPSANTPVGGPDITQMAAEPDEEEELPKLDGAPVEQGYKFNSEAVHKPINYGKKVGDSQSNFLSKLYN